MAGQFGAGLMTALNQGAVQVNQILRQQELDRQKQERAKALFDLKVKEAKQAEKRLKEQEKALQQLSQSFATPAGQQVLNTMGPSAPSASTPSAPGQGQSQVNSQELAAQRMMLAQQAGLPANVVGRFGSRAFPNPSEITAQQNLQLQRERFGLEEQKFEQEQKISAERQRGRNQLIQHFSEQAVERGDEDAAKAAILVRAGRMDEAIAIGFRKEMNNPKTMAQAFLAKHNNNPDRAARDMLRYSKDTSLESMLFKANNPDLSSSVRNAAKKAANQLMAFRDKAGDGAKIVFDAQGNPIVAEGVRDVGFVDKLRTMQTLVPELKSAQKTVMNFKPKLAQVDSLIDILETNPRAFTVSGNVQVFGEKMLTQVMAISEGNTALQGRIQNLLKTGLTTDAQRVKFYKEAAIFFNAVANQDGDSRLSDPDYRASSRQLGSGIIPDPTALLVGMQEIRGKMQMQHENAMNIIGSFQDPTVFQRIQQNFAFPERTPAGGAASTPAASTGSAPPSTSPAGSIPITDPSVQIGGKPVSEMTEEEIDREIAEIQKRLAQ